MVSMSSALLSSTRMNIAALALWKIVHTWKSSLSLRVTRSLPSQGSFKSDLKCEAHKKIVHDFEELKHCVVQQSRHFFPTNQDFPSFSCQFILKYHFSSSNLKCENIFFPLLTPCPTHPVKFHPSAVNIALLA